ncbi:hypothetical protein [Rathayibacter toxicus]|nr:hypothetical protein [Rathayibacter toxicus]
MGSIDTWNLYFLLVAVAVVTVIVAVTLGIRWFLRRYSPSYETTSSSNRT